MAASFSFSFSGDDIGEDEHPFPPGQSHSEVDPAHPAHPAPTHPTSAHPAAPAYPVPTPTSSAAAEPPSASAFPVQGKPLLPPVHHDLDRMLSELPSKVAYGTVNVPLPDQSSALLARRELWDIRLQLMAEDDSNEGNDGNHGEHRPGLGEHDVKTGIYEGGFKSWESSVDLVKVLASEGFPTSIGQKPYHIIELGCGTALPSLALLLWSVTAKDEQKCPPLILTLADYNPSVLHLVTLPNLILTWAIQHQYRPHLPHRGNYLLNEALSVPGELELTSEVKDAFKHYLIRNSISLTFLSGAWSPEFVDLLYNARHAPIPSTDFVPDRAPDLHTVVIGAETIYSPFALASFSDTVLSILRREQRERPGGQATALVAAKRLYFGVGGSLDDFVEKMRGSNVTVQTLSEETEGVRRGTVRCLLA